MEDFSSFIHEELFLIDAPSVKVQADDSKGAEANQEVSGCRLGIISIDENEEDRQLLEKILSAISVQKNEVFFNESIDSRIGTWLVFSETLSFIDETIQHFSISEVNGTILITSKSLKTLRNSIEDKGKLWGLLKGHFNT